MTKQDAEKLVLGLPVAAAEAAMQAAGGSLRVWILDGVDQVGLDNLAVDRANVEVSGGVVTRVVMLG